MMLERRSLVRCRQCTAEARDADVAPVDLALREVINNLTRDDRFFRPETALPARRV